jgi:hypothetical protein
LLVSLVLSLFTILQRLIAVEPHAVILCVQQLLVALFATYKPAIDSMQGQTEESLLNIDSLEDDSTDVGHTSMGFFERCIVSSRSMLRHRMQTTVKSTNPEIPHFGSVASVTSSAISSPLATPGSLHRIGSTASLATPHARTTSTLSSKLSTSSLSLSGSKQQSMSRSRSSTLAPGFLSKLAKSAGKAGSASSSTSIDRSSFASYIELFEPLVIQAMSMYTHTSDHNLQQQIIFLVNRLLGLRVNYTLLDKDFGFLSAIREQVQLIESGFLRGALSLLKHIFQFLVLVSPVTDKLPTGISIPEIIGMADSILASDNISTKQAVIALRPIVYELFAKTSRIVKHHSEADLQIQREVVISTLLKFVKYPAVLDQFCSLLKFSRTDLDLWRKVSFIVWSKLLQLLSSGDIHVSCTKELAVLHQLLANLSPDVLRPLSNLVKSLILAAPSQILLQSASCKYYQALVAAHPSLSSRSAEGQTFDNRISGFLILLRQFCVQAEEDLLGALVEISQDADVEFSSACNVDVRLDTMFVVISGSEPQSPSDNAANAVPYVRSELVFIVSMILDVIHHLASTLITSHRSLSFLQRQQFAQLLQSFFILLSRSRSSNALFYCAALGLNLDIIQRISQTLSPTRYPLIRLWWCQILALLKIDNRDWWHPCLFPVENGVSVSCETLQRGSFLSYCEFILREMERHSAADDLRDADNHRRSSQRGMSPSALEPFWTMQSLEAFLKEVPVHWIRNLIAYASEVPVQELCLGLFRRPETANVVLERIKSCLNLDALPSQEQLAFLKLCRSLPSSLALLQFILESFFQSRYISVRSFASCVASDKLLELDLSEAADLSNTFNLFIVNVGNPTFYPRLIEAFQTLGMKYHMQEEMTIDQLAELSPDVWLQKFVARNCALNSRKSSRRSLCELLNQLDPKSIETTLGGSDFDYSILVPSLQLMQSKANDFFEQRADLFSFSDWTTGAHTEDEFDCKLAVCIYKFLQDQIDDLGSSVLDTQDYTRLSFTKPRQASSQNIPATPEKPKSWYDIVHLCHTLSVALRVKKPSEDVDFAPLVFPSNQHSVYSAVKFSLLALRGLVWRLGMREFVPWELEYVLECIAEVQRIPLLDSCLEQRPAFKEFYMTSMTELFYSLYHNVISNPPIEPAAVGMKSSTVLSQGQYFRTVVANTCAVAFEQSKTPETDASKQLAQRLQHVHHAHLLARYLSRDCSPQTSAKIVDGIFQPTVRPMVPLFIVQSFQKAFLPFLRMQTVRLQNYMFSLRDPSSGESNDGTQESFTQLESGGAQGSMIKKELILEEPLLHVFVQHMNVIGWSSRAIFLYTWDLLIGALRSEYDGRADDEIVRLQSLAIHGVTSLLVQTTLRPTMGDPLNEHLHIPRIQEINFLQTQLGKRLEKGQSAVYQDRLSETRLSYCMLYNLERPLDSSDYGNHQVPVSVLRSMNSASKIAGGSSQRLGDLGMSKAIIEQHEIEKCINELKGIYTHWLNTSRSPFLIEEVLHSIVLLSDMFVGRGGLFQWMLGYFLELAAEQAGEDDFLLRHLVTGICKGVAVLHITIDMSPHFEAVQRTLLEALNSGRHSNQLAGLHGLMYLLDGRVSRVVLPILDALCKLILRGIRTATESKILLMLYSTAFAIIEQYPIEAEDVLFTSQVGLLFLFLIADV